MPLTVLVWLCRTHPCLSLLGLLTLVLFILFKMRASGSAWKGFYTIYGVLICSIECLLSLLSCCKLTLAMIRPSFKGLPRSKSVFISAKIFLICIIFLSLKMSILSALTESGTYVPLPVLLEGLVLFQWTLILIGTHGSLLANSLEAIKVIGGCGGWKQNLGYK